MTSTATERRWGVRSIAALLVFVIAFILTPIGLVGHWGNRTVIDAQRYIDTVGPLAAQPEVQEAVTKAVTDAVVAKMNTQQNVEGLLTNLFPDRQVISGLSGPIAAGINSAVGTLVAKFVASDQFQTLWIDLNKVAQKSVSLILQGKDGDVVSLQGEDVVLNISSLLTATQQYLVSNGVDVASKITIPDNEREIVLFQSPALAQLRFIYSLANPLLQWMPLICAALFALALWLSRRRARMAVAVGVGVLVSALLIKIGLSYGEQVFVDQLSTTVFAPASTVFWDTMFNYLVSGINAIALLGVLIIFAGWLSGRTKSARYVRGQLTAGFDDIGSRLPAGLARFGASIGSIQVGLRWIVYGLGLLVILATDVMSVSVVFWVSALAAGVITVIEILAAAGNDTEVEVTVEVIEVEA